MSKTIPITEPAGFLGSYLGDSLITVTSSIVVDSSRWGDFVFIYGSAKSFSVKQLNTGLHQHFTNHIKKEVEYV